MIHRIVLMALAVCAWCAVAQAQATNFDVSNVDMSGYEINGIFNPPLILTRGRTYTFTVTATASHPFYIKTVQGAGTANQYSNGVTNQGVSGGGVLTFAVPLAAPATLWYQCGTHGVMSNTITTVAATVGAPLPALGRSWFAACALGLVLLVALLGYRRRARA